MKPIPRTLRAPDVADGGRTRPRGSTPEMAPPGSPSSGPDFPAVRFPFRHLLVPLDFSAHARGALNYARPMAEQFGARITLLHVVEPMNLPTDFGYAPLEPATLDDRRMENARQELARVAHELGATVPVDPVVRFGRAWKEIVDTARSKAVDVLIISTHGYTGIKYALLGSVAEKIVRHSPCPVLVVRWGETDPA